MPEAANGTTALETTGDGVLARLSAGPRDRLRAIARPARYGAGAEILTEGADTPFLGVIEAGRVALRLRVPERGERLTFVTIEPGELVGWSALVPPFRATVDAVATDDTRILAIDGRELRDLLRHDAEVAAELLPLVLETLSLRLGASWHQLLDMFGARALEPW